jgi:DeoR family myo-inositol catabolism operon transcriptional repressor
MKGTRLQAMQDYILERRHATLNELCDAFEVSIQTVRRDTEILARWGSVEKVYGGVVANPHFRPYLQYRDRSASSTAEKRRIARAAAAFVEDGDIIMMDTGSTVSGFAEAINPELSLTVITNNMNAIALMTRAPSTRLISLGGEYSPSANGFVGAETLETLQRFKAGKAIISVTGILPDDGGITNAPSREAEVKRAMVAASLKTYLLVDSSKFGIVSLVNVISYAAVDFLITDAAPDQRYLDAFARHDVELIIA